LAAAIAPLLQPDWRVADVGCGDGQLASLLMEAVPGLKVEGFELAARPATAIPVHVFDGSRLPVPDKSFDAVLFVDVLHHTPDPAVLLAEAARVASRAVVIKDHRMARPLAGLTLRFMDWVGNRPHGVVLPYNYWPENRWRQTWNKLGLIVDTFETRIGLYPWPASWAFECGLHFVARLTPAKA
jgi:SAM-dependent methyltransferase